MKLFEYLFELFGYGQAEVGSILQDGESVVCNRPEDDRGTQDAGLVQDMDIQNLGIAHQQEGQHLPAEASKAHGGTELSPPRKTEANGCEACDDASGEHEIVNGEPVDE